jgi:transposase
MRAYSLDLRKKVLSAYYKSQHKSNVCKQFGIARSTLDEWILLESLNGSLNPLSPNILGRPAVIQDLLSFDEFIKSTPFKRVRDLIEPFEKKFGYKTSYAVLWRTLKKLGWTKAKGGHWEKNKMES